MSTGEVADVSDDKRMRLRYAGTCRECGTPLPAGTHAIYERSSKTVRCLACPVAAPVAEPGAEPVAEPGAEPVTEVSPEITEEAPATPSGQAGGSARREFERRRDARERRVKERHPRIGGFLLAVTEEPQSTRAWDTGARGEEALGRRLDALSEDVRVLHDRRSPRSRANIDHIVTTPHGVFVVDAKKYKGRPTLRVEGGLFRPRTEKLLVGGRDRSTLVDGVLKQVELVRAALDDETPVRGVLCFVDADWPLIGGSFETRGVAALWPKRLVRVLTESATPATVDVVAVHARVARAFPSA